MTAASTCPSSSASRWSATSSASSRRRGCSAAIPAIARRRSRGPSEYATRPVWLEDSGRNASRGPTNRSRGCPVSAVERQEVRAVAKWVRMSPRKARLVAEHIRGRSVPEARTVLAFTQRAAAREVEKVLRSAVANAEANHGLIGDNLVVAAAYVDEGPVMKRWRARVGVIHDWKSNWYTGNKDFADFLQEDVRIRKHIYNKLAHAGLSDILIRKDAQRITIDIYTARPGIVIGKSGVEVDALRKDIHG